MWYLDGIWGQKKDVRLKTLNLNNYELEFTIMYQYQFISCDQCSTVLIGNTGYREYRNSVIFWQLFCKTKTILKQKTYFKKNDYFLGSERYKCKSDVIAILTPGHLNQDQWR